MKLNLGSMHDLVVHDQKSAYDLKDIQLIKSMDSLFTLDKEVRECEEESKTDCSNRQYMDVLVEECQCLPLQLKSLLPNVRIQKHGGVVMKAVKWWRW